MSEQKNNEEQECLTYMNILERIKRKMSTYYGIEKIFEWTDIDNDFNDIENVVMSLEIIREKEVNVHFLLVCMDDFSNNDEVGREEYNKQEGSYWHTANALTKNEYTLLKETLWERK